MTPNRKVRSSKMTNEKCQITYGKWIGSEAGLKDATKGRPRRPPLQLLLSRNLILLEFAVRHFISPRA